MISVKQILDKEVMTIMGCGGALPEAKFLTSINMNGEITVGWGRKHTALCFYEYFI